jgi:hypothetical protein
MRDKVAMLDDSSCPQQISITMVQATDALNHLFEPLSLEIADPRTVFEGYRLNPLLPRNVSRQKDFSPANPRCSMMVKWIW